MNAFRPVNNPSQPGTPHVGMDVGANGLALFTKFICRMWCALSSNLSSSAQTYKSKSVRYCRPANVFLAKAGERSRGEIVNAARYGLAASVRFFSVFSPFSSLIQFVAPFGAYEALLGTNPIAVAIPREEGKEPVVLDMATAAYPCESAWAGMS